MNYICPYCLINLYNMSGQFVCNDKVLQPNYHSYVFYTYGYWLIMRVNNNTVGISYDSRMNEPYLIHFNDKTIPVPPFQLCEMLEVLNKYFNLKAFL